MPAVRVIPEIRFKGFTAHWEQRELKDLCENFSYGLNAPAIEFNGRQKYLRITDIDDTNRRFKTDDLTSPGTTRNDLENYALHEGDIVFARTGASVGKTYKYNKLDGNVYYAGFLIKAHVNKDNDVEFVFQNTLTKQYDNFVRLTSQRSGQPGVNANEYKTYKFSCTSLDEQIRIASALRHIDNLINLHQYKCDYLKEIKKTLLKKMFPANGEFVPAIRFKGFIDTWEPRMLCNLISINSGKDYKHLNAGNIPVYGTGGYMLSVNKALSEHEDAIGLGRKGTIDKPYVLKAPFWTVDTLFYCIPLSCVSLSFMNCIFHSIDWKNKDESTGVPSLSKIAIGNTETRIPESDEQTQIGFLFDKIDNLINLHQRKFDMLKEIKQTLLSKMFV